MTSHAEYKSRKERTEAKLAEPEFLDTVIDNVANGGSLVTLCETWDIRFSDAIRWIYAADDRKKAYEQALVNQSEWMVARVLSELKSIGMVDVRQVFEDDGSLKAPNTWPEPVARAIAGVDIFEEFEGRGEDRKQIGWTKKLKMNDKVRALELLGKHLKMFAERHEHFGKVSMTLEDLVNKSMAPAAGPSGPTAPSSAAPQT